MSPLQYRRWYDFSRRLALRGFESATPARRARIAKEVRHVLWILEDDVPDIADWDSSPAYVCDRISCILDSRHYHERFLANGEVEPRGNLFLDQVTACIRAGLDVASAPSAGVLGFTVGDLRRMYPLGLPEWIAEYFKEPITPELADDLGVWL